MHRLGRERESGCPVINGRGGRRWRRIDGRGQRRRRHGCACGGSDKGDRQQGELMVRIGGMQPQLRERPRAVKARGKWRGLIVGGGE